VVYKAATLTASILLLQGIKILAFKILWSVMVRIVSCLYEGGNLVIKSTAIVWKGSKLVLVIGYRGGQLECLLILFIWQVAHPLI
jgi:hypothetical protein